MKRRFTETQIIGFLREAETGVPVKQLCMSVSDAKRGRRYEKSGSRTSTVTVGL